MEKARGCHFFMPTASAGAWLDSFVVLSCYKKDCRRRDRSYHTKQSSETLIYLMNRFDFLSSLPFLAPCDVVDDGSTVTSWRGLSLSVEAYRRGTTHNHCHAATSAATPDKQHAASPQHVLLGPVYFATTAGLADPTVTAVDMSLDTTQRHLTLTVRPTADDDKKDDKNDTPQQSQDYRILQAPTRMEYANAVEARPSCILLYFDACAVRLFSLPRDPPKDGSSSSAEENSLPGCYQTLQGWQQQRQQRNAGGNYPGTSYTTTTSPTTPSASPPAAQTVDGSSEESSTSPRANKKRPYDNHNHMHPRTQATRDTYHQLRNLRALLAQPYTAGGEGAAATRLPQPTLLLQPLTLQTAVYCQDDRRAMATQMQRYNDDQVRVQQELRQALDAFFPVPRRPRRAASQRVVAATEAAAVPPPAEELVPQLETLLAQHETLAVDRHALGISAMPRFLW